MNNGVASGGNEFYRKRRGRPTATRIVSLMDAKISYRSPTRPARQNKLEYLMEAPLNY